MNALSQFSQFKPKVICDESFAVKAKSAWMKGLTLSRKVKLNIKVIGLKNTAKGFNVYVMPLGEWSKYQKGQKFNHYPALYGLNVIAYNKTAVLPKGKVAVVVANANNILKPMHTRLIITANPK